MFILQEGANKKHTGIDTIADASKTVNIKEERWENIIRLWVFCLHDRPIYPTYEAVKDLRWWILLRDLNV